jgi:hypothetical protein
MVAMEQKLSAFETVGGWISTLLLGKTKELIVRIDERVFALSKSVDRLENSAGNLEKSMGELRIAVAAHDVKIEALQLHTGYGVAHSPTVPSARGVKLLHDSGFDRAYPSLRRELFALMDGFGVKTLYDYERGAMMALDQSRNDSRLDGVKNYALNNPEEPPAFIFMVASWMIRDDYAAYKNKLAIKT